MDLTFCGLHEINALSGVRVCHFVRFISRITDKSPLKFGTGVGRFNFGSNRSITDYTTHGYGKVKFKVKVKLSLSSIN
jgi:hypothetical protein